MHSFEIQEQINVYSQGTVPQWEHENSGNAPHSLPASPRASADMPSVQNPALFNRLDILLGAVTVTSRGEARIVAPDGKTILRNGEHYVSQCPFCRKHAKLSTSYKYDPIFRPHLARCWKGCLADRRNRRTLSMMLTAPLSERVRTTVISMAASPIAAVQPPEFPSTTLPLTQLPANHQATNYLLSRNFDPSLIERYWRVFYCEHAVNCRPTIHQRLVIPLWRISQTGILPSYAGWQARAIGDGFEQKYLFPAGLRKSELVYGLDHAVLTQPGLPIVVLEGVTAVWRLGPGGVATFGKTPSARQVQLLVLHGAGRPLVVFGDADALPDAHATARRLRTARQQIGTCDLVAVARLPPGRLDPAECTFEEAWSCVHSALNIVSRT